MNKKLRWGLVLVCLITAVLRTRSLFLNDFHADEALFASWARHIAVWRDPLLLTQAVDKPPLLFYVQALFYPFQGPVEWAARLPNYVASIMLVPLVGVVVWRLFRRWETAVFAAALVSFSPIHIQFSASAFTDPLLTTFLFVSVGLQVLSIDPPEGLVNDDRRKVNLPEGGALSGKRPFYSGFFFGLAILTKHQAWLFLPLIVASGLLLNWWREWLAWLRGFLPLLLLGWGWELVRNGRLTLISRQVSNVGGFGLIEWYEFGDRIVAWGEIGQFVVSYWVIGILVIGILAHWGSGIGDCGLGIGGREQRSMAQSSKLKAQSSQPKAQSSKPIAYSLQLTAYSLQLSWLTTIALFIIGYSILHLIVDIPVWDRYLLPLVPFTAVFLAAGFDRLMGSLSLSRGNEGKIATLDSREGGNDGWIAWVFALLGVFSIAIVMIMNGWLAANGRLPIGARPFADSGAAVVADALADEPYGTVLYDYWYSWHWQYHLFDKKVHLNWFPDIDMLLEDLDGFFDEQSTRYIALPNDSRGVAVEETLRNSGYSLQSVPIEGETNISLYRVRRE